MAKTFIFEPGTYNHTYVVCAESLEAAIKILDDYMLEEHRKKTMSHMLKNPCYPHEKHPEYTVRELALNEFVEQDYS